MIIYLIGSLRNPRIPDIGNALREAGHEVFDDWYAAGEKADDAWRDYEKSRGRTFPEALSGLAAQHVFSFDRKHLEAADIGVLVLPAGKSGHIEMGWLVGRGRSCYVLLDNLDRWDVMYMFASGVFVTVEELLEALK